MPSVTSFFNPTLCKKSTARFWPLWAAYLLMWLLAIPLRLLSAIQRDARIGDSFYQNAPDIAQSLARDTWEITLIAAIGMGLLVAMAMFSFLYAPRSANFMLALPLKRDTLFLTQYLTGLAFFLLPNLLVFVLTLLLELVGGCLSLPPLLAWLAASSAISFFFYALAAAVAQICGHLLALPAFFAIFNGLAAGLYTLIGLLLRSYYYGFSQMSHWVEQLVLWLTPAAQLLEIRPRWTAVSDTAVSLFELRNGWYLLVYVGAGLLLTALAWLGLRRRRMESAGDVVAVRWLKPVFQYSVALCSGLAFGFVTGELLSLTEPGLTLSVLLWTLAGGFIARMLLDKSVRVLSKWREPVLAAAVMLAVCAVFLLDLTGYEQRLPEPAQVAHVTVSGVASYPHDAGDRGSVSSDDPALIAAVVDIHRAIVEGRHDGRNYYDAPNYSDNGRHSSFSVTYILTNGATLQRSYSSLWQRPDDLNRPGTMTHAMEKLVQLPAYHEDCYHLEDGLFTLLDQGGQVEHVSFHGWANGTEFDGAGMSLGANNELARAIERDLRAGRMGRRSLFGEEPEQYAYVYLDGILHAERQTVPASKEISTSHLQIFLSPEATESWPLLMEMLAEFQQMNQG